MAVNNKHSADTFPETPDWTKATMQAVSDTKKIILRRKILLNIVIESYSTYDGIFRAIHLITATIASIMALIDLIFRDNEAVSYVNLFISIAVAVLTKIKDYVKYDKLKDQAKQQSMKYQQIYQKIDRELRKHTDARQNQDEFITNINREMTIIESDDMEIPQRLKEKYIKLCKEKGIPHDEDIQALEELFHGDEKSIHDEKSTVNPVRTRTQSSEDDKAEYRKNIATLNTSRDLEWTLARFAAMDA